ncbi:MAG: 1,4-beta-xylanase, partial [Lachnospiraceae bacterium]|nr:1,4-beta-xylanase [Lachnospiraceae bacterium]
MNFIKGVTFAPFACKGLLSKKETKDSFEKMLLGTGAGFIILVPNGLQDTPQSEHIDFTSDATMTDEELIDFIKYAKSKNIRVALKPTANCKNGTWRAHINFFDEDVPCEPKWGNWFASYTAFQLHYAAIAEQTGCDMFIAGCEMVQTERREAEWRKLIADIR